MCINQCSYDEYLKRKLIYEYLQAHKIAQLNFDLTKV